MVAPGWDFVVVPLFGPKLGEDKKKRSSLQNEWVFDPKVYEDQKKRSLPQNRWVFGPNEGRDQTK